MATSICTSNLTSGFIDLATYDELEKYMYGGADATAYFVREVRKSTWFTQVPVCLSRATGNAGFGNDWSASISRAGDYLLYTWLRVNIPAVSVCTTVAVSLYTACNTSIGIRWTQNLGHNLIKECCISFNDLVAARFDHYHLDFWTAFTLPEAKKVGYYNMIGNIPALTGEGLPPLNYLPAATLNVPLPFWFSRDSGVALPTAALPYNEMRINITFRNWWELLIADAYGTPTGAQDPCWGSGTFPPGNSNGNSNTPTAMVNNVPVSLVSEPFVSNGMAHIWANYAIVSNDERKRMACAPRDILIEQVQTSNVQSYNPSTNQQPQYDIRFSHAIKALFFAVRNATVASEWSNYTDYTSLRGYAGVLDGAQILTSSANDVLVLNAGADPIEHTSLVYENTQRLAQQQSDYYSFVQPWYHAPRIPDITGYHLYSYSLDFFCLDPMGSTNYGKLTNVSLIPKATDQSKRYNEAALFNSFTSASPAEPNCPVKQTYSFVTTVINNNIVRISGGALGFPIL